MCDEGCFGHLAAKLSNTTGHHAPDQQFLIGCDGNEGIAGIGGPELYQATLLKEALDGRARR